MRRRTRRETPSGAPRRALKAETSGRLPKTGRCGLHLRAVLETIGSRSCRSAHTFSRGEAKCCAYPAYAIPKPRKALNSALQTPYTIGPSAAAVAERRIRRWQPQTRTTPPPSAVFRSRSTARRSRSQCKPTPATVSAEPYRGTPPSDSLRNGRSVRCASLAARGEWRGAPCYSRTAPD
jgi:hypothetical protein